VDITPPAKENAMNIPPPEPRLPKRFFEKHAMSLKLAWVFLLFLVLLIPLGMVRGVLRERMMRRNQAASEITSSWGGQQMILGPVLVIPYHYQVKAWREQMVNGRMERLEVDETRTASAFFLPSELSVTGAITPRKLHRGIYEAVVYEGTVEISGRFTPPDFAELGVSPSQVLWKNAEVTLGVSDLRGTGKTLAIELDGRFYEFAPGCRLEGCPSGITAKISDSHGEEAQREFRMTLDLKGSQGIRFAPVGKQNNLKLSSPWPDPSFQGAFLPKERQVASDGFSAAWEVSWYGRNYPQASTDPSGSRALTAAVLQPSLYGVDFLSPVDAYRMAERGMKYGALFIALIFTTFFLFEILAALRIHSVQYTLVGAALCLFYLSLLALSEFIRFAYAYWIGAAAATLLITLYCLTVLGTGKRTLRMGLALLAIYAYLYWVLQLQDYALLLGTVGLFVVLGIVMFATRNMEKPGAVPAAPKA
jgi:inner membrane protein